MIVLVALIMVVVASLFFFIVDVTALFVVAYIFALVGIILFCCGNLYLLASPKSYPWFASFPIMIWRYLISQIILSAVFVILENVFNTSVSIALFIVLHLVLHAFFAVFLVLLAGGKDIIEKRDAEVKEKVLTIRYMQANVETLMRKFPQYTDRLRQVAEALRYSDPMSHPSLAPYEDNIISIIIAMDSGADIEARCDELLHLIADRNARTKLLK